MSYSWHSDDVPQRAPIGPADRLRIAWRGVALGTVTFGCLALLLALRLVERPVFGQRRPITPFLTQFVCRAAFVILRMRWRSVGRPVRRGAVVVANHVSWLDIFALNAGQRIYFVSKSEVRRWPGIGWLARATGTVFIDRDARAARAQRDLVATRLGHGHKLLFFPEGTSTDGRRVLAFRTPLFQALFDPRQDLVVQPVAVVYRAPPGADPRYYGWWGDMDFADHLRTVLATPVQGEVTLAYLDPVRVRDFPDRKALARACEERVRAAFDALLAA